MHSILLKWLSIFLSMDYFEAQHVYSFKQVHSSQVFIKVRSTLIPLALKYAAFKKELC